MNYDDETLMAYADGELEPAQRAEIDAVLQRDPMLARRVERHRALRAEVAGAFSPVIESPVPERLVNFARGGAAAAAPRSGKVLQFPARAAPAPGPRWRAREWAAMAASLFVGVLISWRLFAPADSGIVVAGKDALLARGELAKALESQLASGQGGDEPVLIGLTFKSRDGAYCRTFTLRSASTSGLACRVGPDWQVPAIDSSSMPQGQMQQAGSALNPAILQALGARIDGEPLDAEQEKNAQHSGWVAR